MIARGAALCGALCSALATATAQQQDSSARGPAPDASHPGAPVRATGAAPSPRAPVRIGAWLAGINHSAFHTRTGVTGHRDFYLTAVRATWPVGDPARAVRGSYFIDVVPYAVSTGMPEYVWNRRCRPGFACPGATPIPHTATAFGLSPFGWGVSAGSDALRAGLEASAGALYFSRPVPDPEATRFNFTFSLGPALELAAGPRALLRIGYVWHHTSNGGTGRFNPGLNSDVLTFGVSWRPALR